MEDGKTIYHAGETAYIPEMNRLEKINLGLLPSGGTYTMNNPKTEKGTN